MTIEAWKNTYERIGYAHTLNDDPLIIEASRLINEGTPITSTWFRKRGITKMTSQNFLIAAKERASLSMCLKLNALRAVSHEG